MRLSNFYNTPSHTHGIVQLESRQQTAPARRTNMRQPLRQIGLTATVLLLAWCPLDGTAGAAEGDDPWEPFRRLVGEWEGEGSGFGSVSDVSHRWEFVLQGKFVRLSTRSVPRGEGQPDEIHEDTGYLSRDTDRGVFVFRDFLSEGFVNTYEVTFEAKEKPTMLFDYRATESAGGMRARMHLTFESDNEYGMVLELASEGKEFAPCQQMKMRRVR
jgi:hypothetical protein